jgi:hypothetical protein
MKHLKVSQDDTGEYAFLFPAGQDEFFVGIDLDERDTADVGSRQVVLSCLR